jgi:hypothetical protein
LPGCCKTPICGVAFILALFDEEGKIGPGCRYCKGYFSYEMSLSRATSSIGELGESKDEEKREIS